MSEVIDLHHAYLPTLDLDLDLGPPCKLIHILNPLSLSLNHPRPPQPPSPFFWSSSCAAAQPGP